MPYIRFEGSGYLINAAVIHVRGGRVGLADQVQSPAGFGYRFEDLAYRFSGKIMQPLLVTIEATESEKPITLISHKGQEFNLVIEGTMVLIFGNEEIILNQGDSVYFNAARPHGQKCVGSEKVQFLTVIAE